jgi:thermolysin
LNNASARTAGVAILAWMLAAGALPRGQQAPRPSRLAVNGSGASLPQALPLMDGMLRDGTLDIAAVDDDTMIAGRTHERLAQQYGGLPVFGGQLVRQMDGRRLVSVVGVLLDHVSLPTLQPAVGEAEAIRIAEASLGPDAAAVGEPLLGVLGGAERYTLVYRVRVRGPDDRRRVDVNALTGFVEQSVSELRRQLTVGRGTGVFGDLKKMSVRRTAAGYDAVDEQRPAAAFTLDFRGDFGRFSTFFNNGAFLQSDYGFSTDNTWRDGALVDVHAYVGWTYDYYFKVLGRRGLDDRNTSVLAAVHPLARDRFFSTPPSTSGLYINNAFYAHPDLVTFGDGDGFRFDYFGAALDVVAHELTHGVTAYTSNLEYRDEPGALNEAISDILAAGAEFHYFRSGQQPQKGPNFLIGEDITKVAPGFIRSMENPGAGGDPDHYSLRRFIGTPIDDGGVHVNSTIVSHAFFLAVAGGTNRVSGIRVLGVGTANVERMIRVFYRAFSFMLTPFSEFSDARAATLQAAAELYGGASRERAELEQAWTAVGVP